MNISYEVDEKGEVEIDVTPAGGCTYPQGSIRAGHALRRTGRVSCPTTPGAVHAPHSGRDLRLTGRCRPSGGKPAPLLSSRSRWRGSGAFAFASPSGRTLNRAAGQDHANAMAMVFRNHADSRSGEHPRLGDLLCPFLCPLSTNHHIAQYRFDQVRRGMIKAQKPHAVSALMHAEYYRVILLIRVA
jgi:hypothetical protein